MPVAAPRCRAIRIAHTVRVESGRRCRPVPGSCRYRYREMPVRSAPEHRGASRPRRRFRRARVPPSAPSRVPAVSLLLSDEGEGGSASAMAVIAPAPGGSMGTTVGAVSVPDAGHHLTGHVGSPWSTAAAPPRFRSAGPGSCPADGASAVPGDGPAW
ncbi:MAG: hypothetical protein AVDCRST_MAG49-2076 [uncultured Thermomicrobiales bacterium]|uniref:Uncharacterized protein n=1 Tax=uncultured Thermomicrobiales bacterium TaxID=1645740 RepID=A0A6J4UM20_9BACT|nr:MAG: hypothetical protein AVDCRST_MAG49-2076 [uncultured Thermomicrobiales bacterium]